MHGLNDGSHQGRAVGEAVIMSASDTTHADLLAPASGSRVLGCGPYFERSRKRHASARFELSMSSNVTGLPASNRAFTFCTASSLGGQ